MRIYLIGFMGCGKSTFGRKLAKKMKYAFYDLDKLIEESEDASIPDIFSVKGESYFRETESRLLHTTVLYSDSVISCGGGTPCYFNNMDWMKERGMTIYLHLPAERLYNRLHGKQYKRPLIASLTDDQLKDFIFQKLSERESYYLQSDFTINPEKTSARELMEFIQQKPRA